ARMRQIYESYVEAKRRNNERTDKVDYETVAKSLKKMVPKLDRKHKGKRIDFTVVVKDGKVGIKPVVKK
ncbi:MAG: MXAN_5187 C-terminal domain-containing protein, partial [Polyangiales bacterium]